MLKLTKLLKVLGWSMTLFGIIINLFNLLGWSQSESRKDFYNLVINSSSGIPISHLAVKEFIERFPPPTDFERPQITRITKLVLRTSSGFPLNGSLQYMNRLGKRSFDIASFADVRLWSEENKFKWTAWIITLIGFTITVISGICEWNKRGK